MTGLSLVVEQGPVDSVADKLGRVLKLELIGQDRPVIVRNISRVVADNHVSPGDFHTERTSASFSGESIFKATADLHLPGGLDEHALKRTLESLANELMVDVELPDR